MKSFFHAMAVLLALAAVSMAVEVITLGDSSASDFQSGETRDVYVDEAQRIVLAPAESEILSDVDHAWCAAAGPDGELYIGTVPGGVVYRALDGEAEVFFETEQAGVFDLRVLDDGSLVAATGSEGKVFRISPDGTGEVMADLEEPYIFALAVEGGDLFAATGGGGGRIYRLADEVELVYDSPASHILSLAAGGDGILFAGGDNGSLYRVTINTEEASVLFAAPQGVLQALEVVNGTVYAGTAAIAEPRPGAEEQVVRSIINQLQQRQAEPPMTPAPTPPPAKREYQVSNSVYAVGPGGQVREIFKVQAGLVLTLAAHQGRILAGTAGKAGIYSIALDGADEARVFTTDSDSVHSVVPTGDGFVATLGMPGKAVHFAGERSPRGTFVSRVLSGEHVTRWGALRWEGSQPTGTKVSFEVRTGNSPRPDTTWSPWRAVDTESGRAAGGLAPSRFIQYRATLLTASEQTGAISRVEISGLPVNLPPVVNEIEASRVGNNAGAGRGGGSSSGNAVGALTGIELSGRVKISWKASDPNNDKLEFVLAFRDEEMEDFITLEQDLTQNEFEWDTTRVPDGKYFFKVTASDAPANPPGTELSGSRIAGPFTIDNTAPQISTPVVSMEADYTVIKIEARDAASPLKEASYSIDGGRWRQALPVDGIFDSKSETISVKVDEPDARIVMIRVTDRADNTGAVRVILEGGE